MLIGLLRRSSSFRALALRWYVSLVLPFPTRRHLVQELWAHSVSCLVLLYLSFSSVVVAPTIAVRFPFLFALVLSLSLTLLSPSLYRSFRRDDVLKRTHYTHYSSSLALAFLVNTIRLETNRTTLPLTSALNISLSLTYVPLLLDLCSRFVFAFFSSRARLMA